MSVLAKEPALCSSDAWFSQSVEITSQESSAELKKAAESKKFQDPDGHRILQTCIYRV